MTVILTSLLFASLLTTCSKPITDACFTYSPATITTTTIVTFNASCSQNRETLIWNFGDNTADTTVTSVTVMHKYSTTGTYIVTLNATSKDGMSKKSHPTTTQTITVQ